MEKLKLNKDQQKGLDDLMMSDDNIFLTGEAGTGKSFLINHYIEESPHKNITRLASTGIAALLIEGVTFNSFFQLGIMDKPDHKILENAEYSRYLDYLFRNVEEIIIDEISMIPGRALILAEQIARFHGNEDQPWGGYRIIVCGDFYQLPPVDKRADGSTDFCFTTDAWNFKPIFLKEKMRCLDPEYNDILNCIRENRHNSWKDVNKFLNSRVKTPELTIPHLYSRRMMVDGYNKDRLKELPGKPITFKPLFFADDPKIINRMERSLPGENPLTLKLGALVMTTVNNPSVGYYNGSIGNVVDIKGEKIFVALTNGEVVIIEMIEKEIVNAKMQSVAKVQFFPLRLAWAMTIHKSQGQSFDTAKMNLTNLWEGGHGYVALSRLKTSEGLFLEDYDRSVMKVNKEVREFYDKGC